MLSGLLLTAFLMGLGGIAHCAAMCGAPCAAVLPRGVPVLALVGRCLAYTLLGLVAAAGAGLIARWGQQISMLQPIWVMLQAAALMLGLWLLWTGQMPHQINAWGQQAYLRVRHKLLGHHGPVWLSALRPVWPLFAGMVWAVMPCGLLYAALMVAALASEPWGGAAVMLVFALPSALGVWAAPALLGWLNRHHIKPSPLMAPEVPGAVVVPILWFKSSGDAAPVSQGRAEAAAARLRLLDPRWAVRTAGLSLTLIAGWAVTHQLVAQWQAWCA